MKVKNRLLPVCLSAVLTSTFSVGSMPLNPLNTNEKASAADYSYDEDMVLRYDSMAGNVNTNNAFNNNESFYRALPVGNGRIGGMVYGNCPDEVIDLNECTVWSSGPSNNNREGAANYLKEAQDLLKAGKYVEADRLIGSKMIGGGEAKYQMVGGLKLSFGHKDVKDYSRTLDMNDAVARTEYSCNGVKYTRETFVSHPDEVMVTRITCNKSGGISMNVGYDNILNGTVATDGSDTIVANGHGDDDNWVRGAVYFSTRSKVIAESGRVSAGNGSINVSDADSVIILTSVRTNFIDYKTCNGDEKGDAAKDISKAEKLSYDTLYQNHKADYQALFKRVDVDLGGNSSVTNSKTVNTRISEFSTTEDPKMVKTLFQYGRYLMISASRDAQPMNLQGIWNKYSAPAWGSKATTNINYEMNYWPALTTNLEECFTPFVNKALDLQYAGNETAKVHYGISDGWVLHHNTDLWNRTAPIDGTWGQWPVGGAWVSNMLYDAYRFNQNEEYLEKIYPVIKGSASFLNQLMQTAKINGQEYMVINPSTSPELNLSPYYGDNAAYCDLSVTMDNGIARELFKDVSEAADILGKDSTLRDQLNSKLSLIRPETIGKWGQIQEWAQDWDNQNEKHRHISHMYALYPGFEITPTDNPTTAKAASVSLNARGDSGTGWSEAWKLNCWARLEDGEHAYNLVKLLITPVGRDGRLYDNLWDAHPPFQIDGNFGFTSGVAEMLLQSQNDVITLLPAIPEKWSTGHANGLCARGGFEVSQSWSEGMLDSVTILSKNGGVCTLRYGSETVSFNTEAGKEYTLGGDLEFEDSTQLTNLALNKPVTASGEESGEDASLAVDGRDNTKWCHVDGLGGEWIQVDLGNTYDISRWAVKFAGINEDIKYNARDFKIEASTDGDSWTDIADVYGNTKTVCGRNINAVSARYVKLSMITSTQNNDGGARIYELEVYGSDGRPPKHRSAYDLTKGSAFASKHGGIQKDGDGGTAIGYITDGTYAVYRKLDFESGAEGFRVSASSATDGGTIEIRAGAADGELLGKCEITGTEDWSDYKTFTCPVKQCTDVNDIYLVFKGDDGYLFNVEEFNFYGIKGDFNCDRCIDVFDIITARKALTDSTALTSLGRSNSDLDDNTKLETADLVLLNKYLHGKTNKFNS